MSEELHDDPLEDARFEVKFVADATRYHELESWIQLNSAGFRTSYPPRQVNNIYFDTQRLFAYRENLSGASRRAKVRLRWYGGTDRPDRTVLEVKCRRNQLGWKHQFEGGALNLSTRRWSSLCRDLWRTLPAPGRLWLDRYPEPCLINRYQRQYFESPDRRIRATLDHRQQVLDQRLSSSPNFTRFSNLPDTLVVEIKFHRDDYARGSEVIRGIPVRLSRNSKYVIGVQSISGLLGV